MTIARIDNGQVAEYRDDIVLENVPEHKRVHWRSVSDFKPDFDPDAETRVGPVTSIGDTAVTRTWTVQPRQLTEADYGAAIQAHVDATAKSRGYADGVALAGYSTSTIPSWAAEATAFISWRDDLWIYAYTELAKVQGGQRPQPTIKAFIAEMPTIQWPQ